MQNILPIIVFVCSSFCILSGLSQGIPVFKFLTESCGEVPNETTGTGQFAAGIFVKKGNADAGTDFCNLEFLHTGAIVGPNAVFTVLKASPNRSSLVDENGNPLSKVFVVAGNDISDPDSFIKSQMQIREVDAIIPYFNSTSNLSHVVVILYLRTPLDLSSSLIKSICLPLADIFPSLRSLPLASGSYFTVRGFASKDSAGRSKRLSKPIRFTQLLVHGSPSECERRFNPQEGNLHKMYCGWEKSTGTMGVCAPLGAIHNAQHEGRMYLRGLAALVPGKTCPKNGTLFFYDLLDCDTELQNWMLNSMKCLSVNKFSCSSSECVDFDFGSDRLTYDCEHRAIILKPRKALAQASGGNTKNSPAVNVCPIFQYSPGVALTCTQNNTTFDCNQATAGTKLKLQCKPFYISKSRFPQHEMMCQGDGTWLPLKPFSCRPECGRIDLPSDSRPQPLISNGAIVSQKFAFPWHAAVFVLKKGTKEFQYSCGGSLIENMIVVTAAHCVFNSGGKEVDYKTIRIVLGSTSSSFGSNNEASGSQILEVAKIWVPRTFSLFSLSSDIALIKLNNPVEYTESIQPICYLTKSSNHVPIVGSIGLIAGFGKDETQTVSKNLKWAGLVVVSNEDCVDSLGINIDVNEFCAGYRNGTSACEGDSGGGLVFKQSSFTGETSSYVLKGIVSRGIVSQEGGCVLNAVTLFTNLESFGAWLLEILTSNEIL